MSIPSGMSVASLLKTRLKTRQGGEICPVWNQRSPSTSLRPRFFALGLPFYQAFVRKNKNFRTKV